MPRVVFEAFSVDVPRGWVDSTENAESVNSPYTLADRNGVGALQFSVALYSAGPTPEPTPVVLREVVEAFARDRELGSPSEMVVELGRRF